MKRSIFTAVLGLFALNASAASVSITSAESAAANLSSQCIGTVVSALHIVTAVECAYDSDLRALTSMRLNGAQEVKISSVQKLDGLAVIELSEPTSIPVSELLPLTGQNSEEDHIYSLNYSKNSDDPAPDFAFGTPRVDPNGRVFGFEIGMRSNYSYQYSLTFSEVTPKLVALVSQAKVKK